MLSMKFVIIWVLLDALLIATYSDSVVDREVLFCLALPQATSDPQRKIA
jgi:hypothetical protein